MNNKMSCSGCSKQMDFVGRLLMGIFFVLAGISKFMDLEGTVSFMTANGVPAAGFLAWVAALFLVIFGVLLVVGWKRCLTAGLLGAYVVLVTLIFHIGEGQMPAFLKNMAVLGGLCMVIASCNGTCGMGKMKKHEDHS